MNLVEMKTIRKSFSGVCVLHDVDFFLRKQEIHALLGENGAGKSTLMKILAGVHHLDLGTIKIRDNIYNNQYQLESHKAMREGVSVVYQELSVVNELSIEENIFLGRLPTKKRGGISLIDYKTLEEKSQKLLESIEFEIDSKKMVSEISVSEKQIIEICKAIAFGDLDGKIIIMDEPTSSLSLKEIKRLFVIIKKLKKEGASVVYISHKLDEVMEIADRVTVLKDGNFVQTKNISDTNQDDLVSMMVGRDLLSIDSPERNIDENIVFKTENLSRKDGAIRNINFSLRKGEVLGFAGIVGAGRTELMETIVGLHDYHGDIHVNNRIVKCKHVWNTMIEGIVMVPEDRRRTGFLKNFDINNNINISKSLLKLGKCGQFKLINYKKERKVALDFSKLLLVKSTSINQLVIELSGGNQQKVVIGKWLSTTPQIVIFDEPTRGIDVGAKREIYMLLRELTKKGVSIILVSSELTELFAVTDRIAVMKQGELLEILNTKRDATEEKIMKLATIGRV